MDVWRALGALVTGGVSEAVIAATEAVAPTGGDGSGGVGGAAGGGSPTVTDEPDGQHRHQVPLGTTTAVTVQVGGRYQIEDKFLLDTKTGRTWLFDGDEFKAVPVERTKVEMAGEALLAEKLAADMDEWANGPQSTMSKAQHDRFSGLIDRQIKELDQEARTLVR